MTGTHTPMNPHGRAEMLMRALTRRSNDELVIAALIIAIVMEKVRAGTWSTEGSDLSDLLEDACEGRSARAASVAVRCVYVEFSPEPVPGLRMDEMMADVARWERKLWREPGHVRLGMERCVARLTAEIHRRLARDAD